MNRRTSILLQLQKEVIKKFGKEINTATHCDRLAILLKQSYNFNISSQTLRRFFGLIKSDSKTSHFTLNMLSQFCGFLDFKDFTTSYNNSEIKTFFADNGNRDQDYWQKSEQLCKQITNSTELLVSTHHRLMSFPLVRKYFIENHPLRDLIGTVYSQYFLAYLKFNNSNEAKIFAYGFLFKGAFLQQNMELMELYYNKVQETELTEGIHVIPSGLKYGVQLLYTDLTGNEKLFKKYFNEMKSVRLSYIEHSAKSVCSFEYNVLESLIFTNRTKELQFLIENNTFQQNSDQSFIPSERKQTHLEVWKILCAVSYQKMGDFKKMQYYLDLVKLENLGIGWKKYYSLMYYFALLNVADKNKEADIISKLEGLINETYFSYYQFLLDDHIKISKD